MTGSVFLPSEREQLAFGAALAERLPPGSLLFLEGELGTGKTTLVRGLARRLGVSGRVSSPTFTLIQSYPTPQGPLVHADLYRLADPAPLLELGLEELLSSCRLAAIEWGEALYPSYPQAAVLRLSYAPPGRSARWISGPPQGSWSGSEAK